MERHHLRITRRLAAGILTLAIALGTTFAVAAPAHAGEGDGGGPVFAVIDYGKWVAIDPVYRYIKKGPPPPPPGDKWKYAMDFAVTPAPAVAAEQAMNAHIGEGMVLLGEAACTSDPAAADRFQTRAHTEFAAAAKALGGRDFDVSLGSTGILDMGTAAYRPNPEDPDPDPWPWWLKAAGDHIAEGINRMMPYEPWPGPYPHKSFTSAFQALSEQGHC